MIGKAHNEGLIELISSTPEYQILQPLVDQGPGAASAQDVLQKMIDYIAQEISSNKVKSEPPRDVTGEIPYNVSEALTLLACRTKPSEQGRLVEFCKLFYPRKEIDPDSGEQVTYGAWNFGGGCKLWNENDSLMFSVNDAFNFRLPRREYPNDKTVTEIETRADDLAYTPERKQGLVNLNAFAAQLTQAAPSWPPYPKNPMHWAHLAIWAPKAAFEGDIQSDQLIGTTTLEVACLWFTYAAEAMWTCLEQGLVGSREGMSELMAEAGSRYRDTKWMGFNKERWDVWVRGLEEVLMRVDASDEETKKMVETALSRAKAVSSMD